MSEQLVALHEEYLIVKRNLKKVANVIIDVRDFVIDMYVMDDERKLYVNISLDRYDYLEFLEELTKTAVDAMEKQVEVAKKLERDPQKLEEKLRRYEEIKKKLSTVAEEIRKAKKMLMASE